MQERVGGFIASTPDMLTAYLFWSVPSSTRCFRSFVSDLSKQDLIKLCASIDYCNLTSSFYRNILNIFENILLKDLSHLCNYMLIQVTCTLLVIVKVIIKIIHINSHKEHDCCMLHIRM